MNRITSVVLAAVVTTATLSIAVVGAGAGATQPSSVSTAAESQSNAYAGTHVAFEASSDAILDYRVDGERVFENVTVQSQADHHGDAGVGADVGLGTGVDLAGVGLELDLRTETRAEIDTEGSASLTAHDSDRGILTVDAGEEAQYVHLTLSDESGAEREDDDRVLVDTGERTGALVVVGDGEVTVTDEGDVAADLERDSTLVFRSYADGERDDEDEKQERLMAAGTATAEVYAEERDGERVVDAATYGQDVAVETVADSEDHLEMTVERTRSEGTIVIASVSEAAIPGASSVDDLAVTIDGETAAEASSYGELEAGIGEEPRYVVSQSSDAAAAAEVLIAVDHFSERTVTIQEGDADDGDADGDAAGGNAADGDALPGFGAVVAVATLLLAVVARGQ